MHRTSNKIFVHGVYHIVSSHAAMPWGFPNVDETSDAGVGGGDCLPDPAVSCLQVGSLWITGFNPHKTTRNFTGFFSGEIFGKLTGFWLGFIWWFPMGSQIGFQIGFAHHAIFMGKSIISTGPFPSSQTVTNYQRVYSSCIMLNNYSCGL